MTAITPDDEPAGDVNPTSQTIAPTNSGDFSFYLSRPSLADFEPGPRLTFHGTTFPARVTCGRRSVTVKHGEQARLR